MNQVLRLMTFLPLFFGIVASAKEPQLLNAKVQTHSVEGGLEKTFRGLVENQRETAWIGYAVPAVQGNLRICCYSSMDRNLPNALRKGRCKLDGHDDGMNFETDRDNVEWDRTNQLLVLFRVLENTVSKIRIFSDDCELDAGGRTIN